MADEASGTSASGNWIPYMIQGCAPSMQEAAIANRTISVCNGVLGIEVIPAEAGKFIIAYGNGTSDTSIKFQINKKFFGIPDNGVNGLPTPVPVTARMVVQRMVGGDPIIEVKTVSFLGVVNS